MLSRRELIAQLTAVTVSAPLCPLAFARTEADARMMVVILRGAVDGLALAPPYGDGRYASLRGALALATPGEEGGARKIDGLFGLHPALTATHKLFEKRQALVVHAVASPYRKRSHFDAQDVLENGVATAGERRDGWLNRALGFVGGNADNGAALAMAQTAPLILRGANPATTWAPSKLPDASDNTLARLEQLYEDDPFFAERFAQAMAAQSIADGMDGAGKRRRSGNQAQVLRSTMEHAARFLRAKDGPRIAVTEVSGWDTHANQGAASGSLARKFAALDAGLDAFAGELGGVWRHTVVVVVTEFGRTVRVNGTAGTDHGTASAALLLGGAVNGGRVVADWPGLNESALYQGRDLQPTIDLRSVFKTVLSQHLGIGDAALEHQIFPNSAEAKLLGELIRTA